MVPTEIEREGYLDKKALEFWETGEKLQTWEEEEDAAMEKIPNFVLFASATKASEQEEEEERVLVFCGLWNFM